MSEAHIWGPVSNIPAPRKSHESMESPEEAILISAQSALTEACKTIASDPNRTSSLHSKLGPDNRYSLSVVLINGNVHLKLFYEDPQNHNDKRVQLYFVSKQDVSGRHLMGIDREEFDITQRKQADRNIPEEIELTQIALNFVGDLCQSDENRQRLIAEAASLGKSALVSA